MKYSQSITDKPSKTAKVLLIIPLVLAAALAVLAVLGWFVIRCVYADHMPREDSLSPLLIVLVFAGAVHVLAAAVVLSSIALSLTKKAVEPGRIRTFAVIELVISAVLLAPMLLFIATKTF